MLIASTVALCFLSFFIAGPAESAEHFYKSKTIRVIVPFSPGGGYDLYARLLARHMGRHIPGSPRVIVQNIPGGGGMIAQNFVYRVARRDGLTIMTTTRGIALQQVLGFKGVKFNAAHFTWIGSANAESKVAIASKNSNFRNLNDVINSPSPMAVGGVGPGIDVDIYAKALRGVLNANLKLVTGYRGGGQLLGAIEQGELDGLFGFSWSTVKARRPPFINVIGDLSLSRNSELKDMGVTWIFDLPMSVESKQMLELLFSPSKMGRPFAGPPGVPADRVKVLRRAFADTVKDPKFVAEANRARLGIQPLAGEKVTKAVESILNSKPDILDRIRGILK